MYIILKTFAKVKDWLYQKQVLVHQEKCKYAFPGHEDIVKMNNVHNGGHWDPLGVGTDGYNVNRSIVIKSSVLYGMTRVLKKRGAMGRVARQWWVVESVVLTTKMKFEFT